MPGKLSLVMALGALLVGLVSAAGQATAQGGPTVQIGGNGDLGDFLVGPNGHTLYIFTNDTPGESTCFDTCEANWPPLTVAAGAEPSKASGVEGALGIFERPDGSRQVTLDGQPLYYWASDSAPGDATGQGIGGVWFVVEAQTAESDSGSSASPTTASGSGTPAAPQSGTGLVTRGDGDSISVALVVALAGAIAFFGGATALALRRH